MKQSKLKINKLPIIFAIVGSFFVFSAHSQEKDKNPKKKIEILTSKENAKDVPTSNSKSEVESRIPGKLKVHSAGIGLGQTFLRGDLQDNGDDKITLDFFYNYAASHSFDFFANFHYHTHELNQKEVTLTGLAMGIKAKAFQFDSFSPFGVGGLGFYAPKTKREINGQILESESKLTFGWHLGVGVELKLNEKVSVGALAHLHNPFDVKQDNQPEVEGSYSKLMMTALYAF